MVHSAWILLLLCLLGQNSGQETGCVTFNLESNVENLFASDRDCAQFSEFAPWQDGAYNELDNAMDVRGTRFIRPSATGSCSRTLELFPVVNGGIIEVTSFIQMSEGSTGVAYVNALAQNYADGSIVGVAMRDSDTNTGWLTLTIDVNLNVEEVYIILVGAEPEGSLLLIDSMRYISHNDLSESCLIYDDISSESPEDSDDGLPIETSEESEEDAATETAEESGEDATTESPEESGEDATTESPEESGEDVTTESPEKSGEDATTESPEESGEDATTESPEESREDATTDSPEETEEDVTTESPEESGEDATTESPEESREDATTDSPEETEEDVTTESPEESEEDVTTELPQDSEEEAITETPEIDCAPCLWNPLIITAIVIVSSVVICTSFIYLCRICCTR